MKKRVDKLKRAFTIFDIVTLLLITSVLFYSAITYTTAVKTEEYLKNLLLTLKSIYYLGVMAIIHMVISVIYVLHTKIRKKTIKK